MKSNQSGASVMKNLEASHQKAMAQQKVNTPVPMAHSPVAKGKSKMKGVKVNKKPKY